MQVSSWDSEVKMDWQQLISLTIVVLTCALLIRYKVRKHQMARLRACGHDCDCSSGVLEKINKESQPKVMYP